MAVSDDEVRTIAHLARIDIEEQDIPRFAIELSQILEFVAQMDRVDTTDVEPLAHPLELETHRRADEVLEPNLRDVYQSGAPQVERALYLVPKVIE